MRTPSTRSRVALFLGCAVCALNSSVTPGLAMSGPAVTTGCVAASSGEGLDCKGDLSKGIAIHNPISNTGFKNFSVHIHDVTKDIAPAQNPGILISNQDYMLSILSDTTGKRIVTAGKAPGIMAVGAEVLIAHKGDISAQGFGGVGLYAYANAPPPFLPGPKPPRDLEGVAIEYSGNIAVGPAGIGIVARAERGSVDLVSEGNITGGAGSRGIFAVANYTVFGDFETGNVGVTSHGNITLTEDGKGQTGAAPDIPDALASMKGAIVAFNAGAGTVSVTSLGRITAVGDYQNGIAAYSGGAAFGFLTPMQIYSGKEISTAGLSAHGILAVAASAGVNVLVEGDIKTTGDLADAIHVQTGNGALVRTTGHISASGLGSDGIFVLADSEAEVQVNGGTVTGGGDKGAGVRLQGAGQKHLVNRGSILAGDGGLAVIGAMDATETVDNYGTLSGNINLRAGNQGSDPNIPLSGDRTRDVIRNRAGATLNLADEVFTGPSGVLINEGTINPGGAGVVKRSLVQARLDQAASGNIGIDVDLRNGTSDWIDVWDNTGEDFDSFISPSDGMALGGTLAGKIIPHLLSAPKTAGKQQFTILAAESALKVQGLSVASTVLTQYRLLYPDSATVSLEVETRHSADGVSTNESALVTALSEISASRGGDAEQAYLAFLNAPDLASIERLGQQFNTTAGQGAVAGLMAGSVFANGMRSCPVAEGPYGQQRETSCLWATPGAREFHQDAGGNRARIDANTTSLMGGVQTQIAENVWAGAGFSIEDSSATANALSHSDGTWWQLGGVAKWAQGPWKVSGSVSAGQGNIDTERKTGLLLADIATSDTDVTLASSLARFSYSFGANGFYITPMVDLGATWLKMHGFEEQGAGVFNLASEGGDQWIFSVAPALEAGATLVSNGATFRPYVKAGVAFLSDDSFGLTARFASATASSFAVTSAFDDVFATLDAGVQLFSADGINLKLSYGGRFGESSHENGVDAKLSINY